MRWRLVDYWHHLLPKVGSSGKKEQSEFVVGLQRNNPVRKERAKLQVGRRKPLGNPLITPICER